MGESSCAGRSTPFSLCGSGPSPTARPRELAPKEAWASTKRETSSFWRQRRQHNTTVPSQLGKSIGVYHNGRSGHFAQVMGRGRTTGHHHIICIWGKRRDFFLLVQARRRQRNRFGRQGIQPFFFFYFCSCFASVTRAGDCCVGSVGGF